jgi:heme-degrading monooxygenase HmoA
MIARIWHGRTPASKSDAYLAFLKERAVADYQATAGNQGVYLLRSVEGEQVHFLTLTFWESREAIERFAGTPIEKAKYYPEDQDFLLEFEPTVTHYEVFASPVV